MTGPFVTITVRQYNEFQARAQLLDQVCRSVARHVIAHPGDAEFEKCLQDWKDLQSHGMA